MQLLTGTRYTVSERHVAVIIGSRKRDLYKVAAEVLDNDPDHPPRSDRGIFQSEADAREVFEKFKPYTTTCLFRKRAGSGTRVDVEFDVLELGKLEGTGLDRRYTVLERYISPPEETP